MKQILKNWRFWLMSVIGALAVVSLIGVPAPHACNFWLVMLYSKITALAFLYLDYRLFVWFERKGQIDDIINFLNNE